MLVVGFLWVHQTTPKNAWIPCKKGRSSYRLSLCGRFEGCEAGERWFGHFCSRRTYRIGSERRISTLYFCISQPEACVVQWASCIQCLVSVLLMGPDLHHTSGEAITFRLGCIYGMCGAVLPQGLTGSRFCTCHVHCYWASTDGGKVCPTCPGHVRFHCPSTEGLLCVQVSTCPYDRLPGTCGN